MTKTTKTSKYEIPSDRAVTQLIEDAKAAFYGDPNVIGVGVGHRRKGGETRDHELALIVYVQSKLLKGAVAEDNIIPPTFQGMATDVVEPFGVDAPQEAIDFEESHQHSDDMSFVDWPRLNEQWTAEAGDQLEFHGKVQDRGDVCVIEDDGTLVKTINGQLVVDYVAAYKLFRTTHSDIYDFVTFFTDSDNGMPPQGGSSWYRFVFNDTEGIGFGDLDQRPSFGSDTLQGIMFLNQGHFSNWRYVMLQEQGHRWGAFARYRDTADGANMTDHMLGGWGHWALPFDDDRSPMDYDIYNWEASNGDFVKTALTSEGRTYCNLDLYLMGLLGGTEVGDFNLLSNISLISGDTYSATKKTLNIQNVWWAEQQRNPGVATSQKLFKNAFVVLTGDMDAVHDLVDEVDFLRLRFEEDFYEATKTLGRVDTTLGPLRAATATEFRTVTVRVPRGTGRRSIEATVRFGAPVRRANVALNGFKLDFASADHHINIVEADTDLVAIDGNTVRIRVECNYADKNFDDPFSGYVTALVIAEVG